MAYTVVTDSPVYPSQNPYQKIALTANIILSWATSFGTGNVIAAFNKVIPNQDDWTITLDNATIAAEGTELRFYNSSVYSFSLLKNDSALLVMINAGQAVDIVLSDNSTIAGDWDVFPFGGEFNSISTFMVTSSDTSIDVSGGVVFPPGSEVDLKITPSISNIITIDDVGLAVVTSNNPLEWGTTSIVGGSNITVTYGNGVISNPTISLNTEVDGLTSLGVGNFAFTGSDLTTALLDQDINLITGGTGVISLNGLNIDAEGNFLNSGKRVFALFTDTITGLSNTIVVETSTNAFSVTGGTGTYKINFIAPFPNTNYGVFFGFGSTGEPLPPSYTATWLVRETTFVTISVKDDSGELVTDLPDGIAVEIKNS